MEKRKGKKFKYFKPTEFFYITHIDNLKSILEKGIFCHNKAKDEGYLIKEISNEEVMDIRKDKKVNGIPLWDYANLYMRVTNAMLYKVIRKYGLSNIIILGINKNVLSKAGVCITDKNAACSFTKEFSGADFEEVFKKIGYPLSLEYWTDKFKQQVMAEVLVPNMIPPEYIQKIFVPNEEALENVGKISKNEKKAPIIKAPKMFFQPTKNIEITDKLKIMQGDMFYSEMQTLTVSVNTAGVMGAGLASRVRNQFFDVFREYQKVLGEKKLKMGQPTLYERPDTYENTLIYTEEGEEELIPSHWFLIFPTKNHWALPSDKEGIEKGLIFLRENYKKWRIESLALPALGCGLGKLSWKDIGPLMVKYLKDLEIKVEIYLPNKNIPEEQLTKEFLLGEK